MKKKILIVDDDEDIRILFEYNLNKEGFKTYQAENGKVAIELVKKKKPDLILLDVMMPEMDGIEVCEILRKEPSYDSILICFLTARNEDYSQIAGLDVGADDYIAKPIKMRVLVARIKALMRRTDVKTNSDKIIVHHDKYIVEKEGQSFHLPRKEFELISLLISNADVVLTRQDILDSVWGTDIIVGDRTIDVHIRKLRGKFGEKCIKTIKGVGYKFDSNE